MSAQEPAVPALTARQRRDALVAFLDATVALLPGPFRVEDDATPVTCELAGGGPGDAYLLSRFSGAVAPDLVAARERVLAAWREQGLVVVLRDSPPTPQHLVEVPGAGRAVLQVGPRGSALTAETRCAPRPPP